jgi:hypothetical protein
MDNRTDYIILDNTIYRIPSGFGGMRTEFDPFFPPSQIIQRN